MSEWRLFKEGTVPEWTTPVWYAAREAAPHLEQEGHRERLLLTAEFVNSVRPDLVIDVGCGDGGLLSIINLPLDNLVGYDLQQSNVDAALERGIVINLADVVGDQWWTKANRDRILEYSSQTLIVASEMLEHLIDPHAFVRQLHDSGAQWLVATSPYTETAASHYEYHTWAWDLAGYKKMLEDNGWRVVRQETAWISQVLLAERA